MRNAVDTTRTDSSNHHLSIGNLRNTMKSLDGELNYSRGRVKPWQTTAISQGNPCMEPHFTANEEIVKIQEVLDEILCWKNVVDESINGRLSLVEKEILSMNHKSKINPTKGMKVKKKP